MAHHRVADPVRPGRPVARPFRPPGWTRTATTEDVATAHRVLPMHAPTETSRGCCASALHLINPPPWPCEQYLWAKAVLDAADRQEI